MPIFMPTRISHRSIPATGKYVVLERWIVRVEGDYNQELSPPDKARFYKRLIILIRTLFTFTRLLPVFRLYKLNKEVS
jgi:hypothetical protein